MFGKIRYTQTGYEIDIAPLSIEISGVIIDHPTSSDYLAIGYKEMVPDTTSISAEIYARDYFIQTSYEETSTQLIAHNEIVPLQQAKTFSKYKLIAKATQLGIWPQLKQLIEQHGLYDLFMAAQEFKDDNEFFKQGVDLVAAKFLYTRQYIDAILDECIAD